MLYFVSTVSRDYPDEEFGERGTDYWLTCASNSDEVRQMFADEYTKIVEITTEITEALIDKYGGLALLTNP